MKTTADFATESVSVRTVQRRIKDIESSLGVPITTREGRKVYVKPEYEETLSGVLRGKPIPTPIVQPEIHVAEEVEWEPVEPGKLALHFGTQIDTVSRRAELPVLPQIVLSDTRSLKADYQANLQYAQAAEAAMNEAVDRLAQAHGEALAAQYKATVTRAFAEGKLDVLKDVLGNGKGQSQES